MTENEIHARLQHMVGSSDGSVLPNLSTSPYNSKVLKKGEQVYYADLRQWKTGDGVTTIANLPFDNAEAKNNISWSSNAGGTSVGWINIAQIQLNTNNHISGIEFVLHVFRVYTAPSAEDYIFSITTGWNNPNITQINGSGGTRIIEKFRFAVDTTNHILYLQMYVNTSYTTYTNDVHFTLINRWDEHRYVVVPITSGAVADTYNTYFGEIETSIQYPFVGKGLYSNMPQGTAPLKVNSTTQVNNLNADLLDGIHASGFALVDGSNATSAGVSAMINALTTASATPGDSDYYVSQYANGGTSYTTYYRRPISALWAYIKSKADAIYAAVSHTHTKSDVGLGNVANINQSKAIKSITRSGTTFTATALDGTTTTFTQQDNNTTYSDATTSASGLMSAADKTKLDGIDAEANKTVVDGALDINSDNPVKNKIVTAALEGKANIVHGNHVPDTQAANNKIFLRNDNTWATVTPANIGAAATSHSHSDYVTVATAQTITGKKTFSGGMAFTNSLPVNNSMRYFLGIDAFGQGGSVKYADASKMCGMIGAMPVLSAASGISVTNNVMTILPDTEGNFYHVYSVPAVTLFTIKIVGLNMAPGYNLRLVLKGSNTGTDIIFTRPSNDGPNNIHCPYPSAGVASNRVTVLDMCVYDGPIVKEMVILNSASLATI